MGFLIGSAPSRIDSPGISGPTSSNTRIGLIAGTSTYVYALLLLLFMLLGAVMGLLLVVSDHPVLFRNVSIMGIVSCWSFIIFILYERHSK